MLFKQESCNVSHQHDGELMDEGVFKIERAVTAGIDNKKIAISANDVILVDKADFANKSSKSKNNKKVVQLRDKDEYKLGDESQLNPNDESYLDWDEEEESENEDEGEEDEQEETSQYYTADQGVTSTFVFKTNIYRAAKHQVEIKMKLMKRMTMMKRTKMMKKTKKILIKLLFENVKNKILGEIFILIIN